MSDLFDRDRKYVWHPFTQEKTASPAIPVVSADGVWLTAENGKKYMDVNSSWWTILHGHNIPELKHAIQEQFSKIDHVIFAGTTHEPAVKIAENLISHLNYLSKVFYSDNGSTSVEVALKMSFQYWFNKGQKKQKVVALDGAYHGDTFGAMSVGQRDYFNRPFEDLFFDVEYLPFPTQKNKHTVFDLARKLFSCGDFAAFIFEPLVQGAAGMRMYDAEILDELISTAKSYDVICIADEVMTGFYRTGTLFACDQINQKPDIICLSKGVTGGVLPLGLTLATQKIYDAFYDDETAKAFLHGHSFTGAPLSCALACASWDLLLNPQTKTKVDVISKKHLQFKKDHQTNTKFSDVRCHGTILAVELKVDTESSYFQKIRNNAYDYFVEKGFLIRPLGNIIFINPPYCISENELDEVYRVILEFELN